MPTADELVEAIEKEYNIQISPEELRKSGVATIEVSIKHFYCSVRQIVIGFNWSSLLPLVEHDARRPR